MTKQHEQDTADGELVDTVIIADPVRTAFASAASELIAMLPGNEYVRRVAVEELMQAEQRTKARLVRRVLN